MVLDQSGVAYTHVVCELQGNGDENLLANAASVWENTNSRLQSSDN
jgi:hypothetical protein